MSTISASTTSTTAYKVTADTTGTLVLQTGASPTTAVTIDGSQNVGIGTSSPSSWGKFVSSGTSPQVVAAGSSGAGGQMSVFSNGATTLPLQIGQGYATASDGVAYISQQANQPLIFRTNATETMRIDSSGNLFVNATAQPMASNVKAYVNGTFAATSLYAGNGVDGSASGFFNANVWFIQNEGSSTYRSYACGVAGNATYGQWLHYSAKSAGTPVLVFTANNGSFAVAGALSKGSGSFRIDHPLPQLEATHQLVHSFIEGPQADLIYRGKVNLVNGRAEVNIDNAATMTEGTFVALCRDVQCFTTNESDWVHVRGSVNGNVLTIEAQDPTATSLISWMVIGERQDKHMMETGWTDENGKVIVEPLKPIESQPETTEGAA